MAQAKKGKKSASKASTKISSESSSKAMAKAPKQGDHDHIDAAALLAKVNNASRKPKIDRLLRVAKWLAIAYGVQALVLLLFSLGRMYPVTMHFLGVDTIASQAAGHTIYAGATRRLFDVSLPQLLAMSLAISAVLYGIVVRWQPKQYLSWIQQETSPIRWLDGAFSASMLPVAIALVCGLSDATSIAMLFILGFVTHILGLYMESYNSGKKDSSGRMKDYRPFILLAITGATAWLVLGGSIVSSRIFGSGLPAGVWMAYLVGVVCVALYAIVMIRNYRKVGLFADYRNTELASVLISFVAKSTIAWLLFSAVLKP